MKARPLILLSNDDGYQAKGLRTLAIALRRVADVVVCAPDTEQSAMSHSLTLHRPLRLRHVDEHIFSIDGTPADAVYVALHSGGRVLPRRPDLVVAGLNHGLNLGADVFYSGTVAAAREGALRGIPALAASADPAADHVVAADLCTSIALELLASHEGRSTAPLLNVNVPPGREWPVRATRLGFRVYEETVEYRHDPRGREYLWIGGATVKNGVLAGSDTEAYDRGLVGITPLSLDLTAGTGVDVAGQIAAKVGTTSLSTRGAR